MEAKERILSKSQDLFNRYGIRSVSMDDIAAQLGMSKKTLYQYYVDKDELVNAAIEVQLTLNKSECLACSEQGENAIHEIFLSFDKIQGLLSTMNPSLLFDMEKYHPTAFKKFQEFRHAFLYKIIKSNMERGIEEENYRNDFDVDILTRFRINSILLSFNPDVFPTNKSNLVYIEKQLIEHFLYGIASAKGVKLIQKYKLQRTKKEQ